MRPALLQLQDLSKAQSKQPLKTLLSLDLPDELAITTLIGLAAEPDSVWKALRMGELKTLAALACGHLDEAFWKVARGLRSLASFQHNACACIGVLQR